jgi:hypothetical protein
MVDLNDRERYWDLSQYFASGTMSETYCDWEGFADPAPLLDMVKDIECLNTPEIIGQSVVEEEEVIGRQLAKDMVLHWLYETADQIGTEYLPSQDQLNAVADFAHYVFCRSSRYMMRSDAR